NVPDVHALVGVCDLLRVGRPARRVEERGRLSEVYLARLAHARLIAKVQSVLARLVREVCYPLAVGRPGGVALDRAHGVRQVAHVALLRGHAQNLAARLEDGARARRRQRGVAYAPRLDLQ